MPAIRPSPRAIPLAALLFGLIALAGLLIYPGTGGEFLFDSKPNLKAMGQNGAVDTWSDVKAFISHKNSPARSLTFLTFLIHDNTWPTDPWAFKYTNLLLHLINGLLVFVLTYKLTPIFLTTQNQIDAASIICTAFWVLQPIHLSTIFLSVQRLVLLATLFLLLGAIAYTAGRLSLNKKNQWRPIALMTFGLFLGGFVGTLSKGIGVLIIPYVLVLEFVLFRPRQILPPKKWATWATVCLAIPGFLFLLYVWFNWSESAAIYASRRDFSVAERLLTEPRVLLDYIYRILTFRLGGSGIYQDDFTISRSLLQPPTTLPAILAVVSAIVGAIVLRRKWTIVSFGVLWFFAGHLLTGTFMHLELYFLHRNYLPSYGLIFSLSVTAVLLFSNTRRSNTQRYAVGVATLFLLSTEATLTAQGAQTWGSPGLYANVAALENPTSIRAQQKATQYWWNRGRPRKALQHLETGIKHNPEAFDLRLQRVYLDCGLRGDQLETRNDLVARAAGADFSFAVFETLQRLIDVANNQTCAVVDYELITSVIEGLLNNQRYTVRDKYEAKLWHLKAKIARAQRDLNKTIHYLEKARELSDDEIFTILQVKDLLSAGLPQAATAKLDAMERRLSNQTIIESILKPSYAKERQILRLRAKAYQAPDE